MRRPWITLAAVALVCNLAGPTMAKRSFGEEALDAAKLLASWQYDQAETQILALAKRSPKALETRYLLSELAFIKGNYESALDHLRGLKDSDMEGNIGELRQLLNTTRAATAGFAHKKSSAGNFVIYYPPGKEEAIVDLAGDVLESAREALGEDFGYRSSRPIRVELLSSPADLAKVSTLTQTEIETTGTIALCKYGKLMVVSPSATITGYPWMDTLVHEYVHYVVSTMSSDRVPVWLHEGLARYQQVRWRSAAGGPLGAIDEHLLADALRKDELISFDDMHPSMAKLPSQQAAALAFAEVATMVAYLHQEKGYPGIRRALNKIQRGAGARKAISEVMDTPWKKVEQGWMQYLRTARLRPNPQLSGRAQSGRIRFKKGKGSTENIGTEEVSNDKAKKFARLGGMLRARNRSDAAAVEYEKALAFSGGNDPFIAAKLSKTYLELGNYGRAVELAQPLLEADEHDASPATTLGQAHLALGQAQAAADAFEIALRVTPFNPAVRCGLAEAYRKSNRAKLAERETHACEQVRR